MVPTVNTVINKEEEEVKEEVYDFVQLGIVFGSGLLFGLMISYLISKVEEE